MKNGEIVPLTSYSEARARYLKHIFLLALNNQDSFAAFNRRFFEQFQSVSNFAEACFRHILIFYKLIHFYKSLLKSKSFRLQGPGPVIDKGLNLGKFLRRNYSLLIWGDENYISGNQKKLGKNCNRHTWGTK